ncbi:MAG: DUF4339 domain-containing protein [Candidatus Syntrophonatronum acetioxidans]|uniref:DUF4339 domain-containing protein n=1 Tax=Candidatus Syntrophonatronum acetioxidans TaxID=1795816 RepID=A0A424Y905_9FIRM|nr:MAG: DUF4339 domain-containing protein [Candidatus Syntrophonatronum acetioxidans]
MKSDNGEWITNPEELAAYFEQTGKKRGQLDILPKSSDAVPESRIKKDRQTMDPDQLRLLDKCLEVLASPDRVLQINYNIADARVSRSFMATSKEMPAVWVTLSGSGESRRVSFRSEPELRHLIIDVLAADSTTRPTRIGCDLSTEGALAFLAILDQYRRSWFVAMLRHLEPISFFTLQDVKERLADSNAEDFRWSLPFIDKVLPITVTEMSVTKDPRQALLELIEAGLIEPVDEQANTFELTEAAQTLAEGDRQAASRLVLSRTFPVSDDEVAHDVLFFVRTPFELFLLLMSGANASLSTLLPGDLNLLLDQIIITLPEEEISGVEEEKIKEAEEETEQPHWYIFRKGERYGPYLLEELIKYVQEGRLQPDDLLWNEGLTQWVEAGTLEELNFD